MLSVSLHPLVILLTTPGATVWLIFSSDHDPSCAWHKMGGGQNIRELSTLLWTLKLIQTQLSKFARMWSWLEAHTFLWLLFVKPSLPIKITQDDVNIRSGYFPNPVMTGLSKILLTG